MIQEIGRADELGSGVRNISNYYLNYSNIKPVFEDADIFRCVIHINDRKSGQTGEEPQLTKSQLAVLNIIKDNPSVSRREIPSILQISPSAVQKHLTLLKQKTIIKRIGPDFGGHWQIL
jgi:ATP-dependent DNA helicase RecG